MSVVGYFTPVCSYHFVVAVWRGKEAEPTRVNSQKTTIAIVAMLSTSLTLAEHFKPVDGKEYKDATIIRIEADGIVLRSKTGISKIYFIELPKDVQGRFRPSPSPSPARTVAVQREPEPIKGWRAGMTN